VAGKKRRRLNGAVTLLVIAVFKFVKGAAILALVCVAMSLFHKDVAWHVGSWVDRTPINIDNRFVAALLGKLEMVHTKELTELSALGGGYAALFLTEGTGLLLRRRWAEWLTIVATGSLMPLEIYELVQQFTAVRLVVLVLNAAVVLYLVYHVRQKHEGKA